jgi:diacylglycerol kinase (ATP)
LTTAGYQVQIFFEHPSKVPEELIDRSAVAAISVGGDGTLRAMVERLLADDLTPPPIFPVPLGTANLMSRHLGLSWTSSQTPAGVVATIKRNEIRLLDAARANNELFLLVAGVGIDGHIVHLLDGLRTGPIDLTSYLLPAALTFANFAFPAITVTVDNTTILRDEPAVAFIGNIKEYGTGFPILVRARPDDGLLDICIIPCRDRRELAEMLLLVATGEHPLHEKVIYVCGRSVRVESTQAVPVQLDGDAAGHTPVQIEILPGRVPFLVPAFSLP